MSDWDSVTKIGGKHRGAGAAPRETVIKGKSALNAAQRSGGILATEKKYTTGNIGSKTGSGEGQHLTKVDRSDDIVKPKTVSLEVSDIIKRRRNEDGYKMTQKELAQKCNCRPSDIADLECPPKDKALDQAVLGKVETALNIKLRGKNIGQPKFPNKK